MSIRFTPICHRCPWSSHYRSTVAGSIQDHLTQLWNQGDCDETCRRQGRPHRAVPRLLYGNRKNSKANTISRSTPLSNPSFTQREAFHLPWSRTSKPELDCMEQQGTCHFARSVKGRKPNGLTAWYTDAKPMVSRGPDLPRPEGPQQSHSPRLPCHAIAGGDSAQIHWSKIFLNPRREERILECWARRAIQLPHNVQLTFWTVPVLEDAIWPQDGTRCIPAPHRPADWRLPRSNRNCWRIWPHRRAWRKSLHFHGKMRREGPDSEPREDPDQRARDKVLRSDLQRWRRTSRSKEPSRASIISRSSDLHGSIHPQPQRENGSLTRPHQEECHFWMECVPPASIRPGEERDLGRDHHPLLWPSPANHPSSRCIDDQTGSDVNPRRQARCLRKQSTHQNGEPLRQHWARDARGDLRMRAIPSFSFRTGGYRGIRPQAPWVHPPEVSSFRTSSSPAHAIAVTAVWHCHQVPTWSRRQRCRRTLAAAYLLCMEPHRESTDGSNTSQSSTLLSSYSQVFLVFFLQVQIPCFILSSYATSQVCEAVLLSVVPVQHCCLEEDPPMPTISFPSAVLCVVDSLSLILVGHSKGKTHKTMKRRQVHHTSTSNDFHAALFVDEYLRPSIDVCTFGNSPALHTNLAEPPLSVQLWVSKPSKSCQHFLNLLVEEKQLWQVNALPPLMPLYGTLSLFRTSFAGCYAFPCVSFGCDVSTCKPYGTRECMWLDRAEDKTEALAGSGWSLQCARARTLARVGALASPVAIAIRQGELTLRSEGSFASHFLSWRKASAPITRQYLESTTSN